MKTMLYCVLIAVVCFGTTCLAAEPAESQGVILDPWKLKAGQVGSLPPRSWCLAFEIIDDTTMGVVIRDRKRIKQSVVVRVAGEPTNGLVDMAEVDLAGVYSVDTVSFTNTAGAKRTMFRLTKTPAEKK